MLSDKINSYEKMKSFGKQTPAMYKKDYPFLKEVDSLDPANVPLNLQGAIRNCFDKKSKTCNGFPNYKSAKHSRKSDTTNNQNGTIAPTRNGIKLPKIGKVKAVIHRQPNADWKIQSAMILQDRDEKFYVSVLFVYYTDVIAMPKMSPNVLF